VVGLCADPNHRIRDLLTKPALKGAESTLTEPTASDNPQDAQRDRQTRKASSSSERLVVFFLCIVFQARMVQVTSTAVLVLS
jgi:hypothetical protein